MSDWKAYELGVADVVRHKVGSAAVVEHDVRILGRTGQRRQVDIVVRGSVFGLSDGLFVVECKDHRRPIDVGIVDGFFGLVEDIGADLGLIVTASGLTATARARAEEKRLRVRIVTRSDLDRWSPPGTRSIMLSVPAARMGVARNILIEAGYRVRVEASSADESQIEAYRVADLSDADDFSQRALRALYGAGIEARSTGSAVSFAGGTPAHRWIPVYVGGTDVPFRVVAADQGELDAQVAQLAQTLGVTPSDLNPKLPEAWPFADGF